MMIAFFERDIFLLITCVNAKYVKPTNQLWSATPSYGQTCYSNIFVLRGRVFIHDLLSSSQHAEWKGNKIMSIFLHHVCPSICPHVEA